MFNFLKTMRLKFFALLAAFLAALLFFLAPAQFPVVVYKLAVVVLAAVVGYWFDCHLFPYARPHIFLKKVDASTFQIQDTISFSAAMLRRALVVGLITLAVALAI